MVINTEKYRFGRIVIPVVVGSIPISHPKTSTHQFHLLRDFVRRKSSRLSLQCAA